MTLIQIMASHYSRPILLFQGLQFVSCNYFNLKSEIMVSLSSLFITEQHAGKLKEGFVAMFAHQILHD